MFDDRILNRKAFDALLPSTPERLPLSALARYAEGRRRFLTTNQSKLILRGVRRVVDASLNGAFGPNHEFLHDLPNKDFFDFTEMTAQLIFAWERSCREYHVPSPFAALYGNIDIQTESVEQPPIKLILMSAAALRSVSKVTPKNNLKHKPPRRVKVISTTGPKYFLGAPIDAASIFARILGDLDAQTARRNAISLEYSHRIAPASPKKTKRHSLVKAITPDELARLNYEAQMGMPSGQLAARYGIPVKTVNELLGRN